MLVNVITRHAPANYGSLLQAIATQRAIGRLGYDCKIIDYIPGSETGAKIAFTQLKGKKNWNRNPLKKIAYLMIREPENLLMYRKFSGMRKKYLTMGTRCSDNKELITQYGGEKHSIFLTGSDQVWGPISTGAYDSAYFLDFVPEGASKLAYASSFGKASFDKETLSDYKKYLEKYDAIAVRENTAVEIIRQMGINVQQVLDPTLLLTAEEWSEYIIPLKKPAKYVLVYQIHNNPELDRYAARFAQYTGLPLIRVSPLLHQIKRSGKFIYLPDIGGFLDIIKNATYMVTDSFHGTAFAINFNVQFVEILPDTGTSSRNQSILQLAGLSDRIVDDLSDFQYGDKVIEFSKVNHIIREERAKSYGVLEKMLKNKLKKEDSLERSFRFSQNI